MIRRWWWLSLLALAMIVLVEPGFVTGFAGFKRLHAINAPDQLPEPRERDIEVFLRDRDSVELEVPRDMPVTELLALYTIDHAHIRRVIAEQLGVDRIRSDTMVRRGQRLRITLTPKVEGQP